MSWSEVEPGIWYHVYQRDVTAGDTDFSTLSLPITTNSMTAGYLSHGHRYEFYVVTLNSAGESAPSNIAGATAALPLPAAPTNLSATAGDSRVELTWLSTDPDAWYWIHVRDVTAGETQFTRLAWPVDSCCTFTATDLVNAHTYEFRVAAIGSGGSADSATSNVVSARPVAFPPGSPTNLDATVVSGGIKLTWTASSTPAAQHSTRPRRPDLPAVRAVSGRHCDRRPRQHGSQRPHRHGRVHHGRGFAGRGFHDLAHRSGVPFEAAAAAGPEESLDGDVLRWGTATYPESPAPKP